ncbi:MAG TPA: energy-coupling factor ABC transporter permease [Actinomycetota bacterium]|nr:energy-coupling factor ABC transporter permease [Actinomycetota bacterium]
MHIPDGFFDLATSAGAGAVGASGIAVAVRRVRTLMEDSAIAVAGLVAAFLFAAQMINFPVAGGTSGHLLGGALAAILVGPWVAVLCLVVVVFVQALFADGGLTALGLNVVNVALIPALGGYAVFGLLRRGLPRRRGAVIAAGSIAAAASVIFTAAAFIAEYSIGGRVEVDAASVAAAMLSVHALIAIGEAAITAAALSLVLSVRPDLVWGARDLSPLVLHAEEAWAS